MLSSDARNAAAAPWNVVWMLAGMPISRCACLDRLDGLAERRARRQVERHRHRRELADVVDDERRVALARSLAMLESGTCRPSAVATNTWPSASGPIWKRGVDFEHDAVLVGLGVDGRDQPLAEGVVERVVDGRDADAEAAGGVAVDVEEGLQAAVLQSLATSASSGDCCSRSTSLRHPLARAGSRPGPRA